jgi:hypothetical protein
MADFSSAIGVTRLRCPVGCEIQKGGFLPPRHEGTKKGKASAFGFPWCLGALVVKS